MNTKSKSSKVVKFTQEINFLKNLDFQFVKTTKFNGNKYGGKCNGILYHFFNEHSNIEVQLLENGGNYNPYHIVSGDYRWDAWDIKGLKSIVNQLISFDNILK